MAVSSGLTNERPRAPLAVKVIAVIALIFLLERAREVVLPVAIAIILTFLLAPLVRVLRNRGFNDALGAAVVVFGLLFVVGLLGSRLVAPASQWIARAPTSMQQLIDSYERLRKSIPFISPPQVTVRPAVTAKGRPAAEVVPVQTPPASDPIKDKIAIEGVALTGSLIRQLAWVTVSTVAAIILLFFFLASERWLMARTVEAIPKRRVRVAVLGGFRAAQRDIARYLGTQAMINAGVGIATTLALMAIGLPSPILWGVIIAVLGFIPYLGPLVFVALLLLAGTITYTTFGEMYRAGGGVRRDQRDRKQLHRTLDRRPQAGDESAVRFPRSHCVRMDMGRGGRFPGGSAAGCYPKRRSTLEESAALVCLSRPRPARIADDAGIAGHRFAPPPPLAAGCSRGSGRRGAAGAPDRKKAASA